MVLVRGRHTSRMYTSRTSNQNSAFKDYDIGNQIEELAPGIYNNQVVHPGHSKTPARHLHQIHSCTD